MSHPCYWPHQQVLPWKPLLCCRWSSRHLSCPPFLSFSPSCAHQKRSCSERQHNNTLQLPHTIPEPPRAHIHPFTPSWTPTMTPPPSTATTASSLLNATVATTLLPWEEVHMQVHTILIVVIFCVVCLLLILAFFYAFCFHCSIKSSPKDSDNRCSLDREDATFKRSSSDNQSVGNVV